MVKIVGYILGALGLAGIAAYSVPQVRTVVSIPAQVTDTYLLVASLALLLVGAFLVIKRGGGRGKKGREVPIFHGRDVVGYRRH